MPRPFPPRRATARTAVVGLALVAAPLALVAPASASSTGLVISEVYGGGGNTGAPYTNDFIELHNTTGAAIPLTGMSVQYRSATGTTTAATALTGSVPANGKFLVAEAAGATPSTALPTPDATGTLAMSGSAGVVFLSSTSTAVPATDPSVVDLVGYGTTATIHEGATPAPGLTNSTADTRSTTGTDTDDNAADFTATTPAPENTGSGGTPAPNDPAPNDPVAKTIEEIQGPGTSSPLDQQSVVTKGVVTAAYPTGGFNGYYLQTPGTGGALDLATHDTSDAVFVFAGSGATYPRVGDYLQVTGKVSEFAGMTELTPASGGVTTLTTAVEAPAPATVGFPATATSRESLEGMLVAPRGDYTVTDNYTLNQYAEIGLAHDTEPLPQPTDVAKPGPAAKAVEADNATKKVVLDDGSSLNYFTTGKNVPLPYLTPERSIRVGAPATFTRPVVLDYRNNAWKFQPTQQLTATNAPDVQPATFPSTRPAAPAAVGGDLKIASFNVLNFFTETGDDFVADGGTCSFYTDRGGAKVTVNSCNGNGPRGAADDTNLARQQAKIVAAINTLGADVLSLEEIENSAHYAGANRRDDALATLVDALNSAAGSDVWEFVPSPAPADRPAFSDEDVIRTAFIYRRAEVTPVGVSHILQDPAFDNARDPLAQAFRPSGGTAEQDFVAIVNHFKSKGSGVDDGTGQGNSNPDRVAQAKALVAFADQQKRLAGTDMVFLTGDFNAYTQEDPMQVLYDAGYTDVGRDQAPEEYTYQFGGTVGSLDHVLANGSALAQVTGAHVWNINSVESVAYEYSRFNYNVTNFYAPDPYRSSDHDPLLVGFDMTAPAAATTTTASVSPKTAVVRATRPTVTARVSSAGGTVRGGSVTFSSGGSVLGTVPVANGTASLRLPAYATTGRRTITAAYSGTPALTSSAASTSIRVVKATPSMTVGVRPGVIHKRSTRPRLEVAVTAPGQVVRGTVVVRQDGSILVVKQLVGGHTRVVLDPYKHKGAQAVTVRYLGNERVQSVARQVRFTVQK